MTTWAGTMASGAHREDNDGVLGVELGADKAGIGAGRLGGQRGALSKLRGVNPPRFLLKKGLGEHDGACEPNREEKEV